MKDTVRIYKSDTPKSRFQPWRFTVTSPNGKVIGKSEEGFFSKWNAKRAAKRRFPEAEIVEGTES